MKSSLFKSKFVRLAVWCLLVCCCLVDAASGATKKKTVKKKASSSTSASKSDKSSKTSKTDKSTKSTKSSAGTVTINNGTSGGGVTINSGVLSIGSGTGILQIGNDGASGSLSGVGLTKAGAGTFTLASPNAYSGVSVAGGTLDVTGSLSSSGTVNLSSSGRFDIRSGTAIRSNTTNAVLNLSGASNLSFTTGTLAPPVAPTNLVLIDAVGSYTGATTINPGTLTFTGGSLSGTGTINVADLAILQASGNFIIPSGLVTTQYFATQNSKPAGYQQTLGHYLPISNLATTPSTVTLSPAAASVVGPTRPGALAASAGSLASALGLNNTNLATIPVGGVTLNSGSLSLSNSGLVLSGAGTLRLNTGANGFSFGNVSLASPQISVVPEPSTLVLAGFALAGLGALCFRKQRRASRAAV